MKGEVLKSISEQYEEVLADVYGIDRDHETWEVNLYNRLCTMVDIEQTLLKTIKHDDEERTKLLKSLEDQTHVQLFLIKTLLDPNTSSMFKTKLKAKMLEQGLTLHSDGENFCIKVKKAS